MNLDDVRVAHVQTLLSAGQVDAAREAMEAIVASAPEDFEAWFLYALCLNDAGDPSAAVDAALRSWLMSNETNGNAVSMAVDLLRQLPQEVEIPVSLEPYVTMVAVLRNQLLASLGLVPDNDGRDT